MVRMQDVAWCKVMLNKFRLSELKALYKKGELHEYEYEMICQVADEGV